MHCVNIFLTILLLCAQTTICLRISSSALARIGHFFIKYPKKPGEASYTAMAQGAGRRRINFNMNNNGEISYVRSGGVQGYYCPYVSGNDCSSFSGLQRRTQTVIQNLRRPQLNWLLTGNFNGCSFILAVSRDGKIRAYHDNKPMDNYYDKMEKMIRQGATKIHRLDDVKTAARFGMKNYMNRYTYGRANDLAVGCMTLVQHIRGGTWALHVQETRDRAAGNVLQTYLEGGKKTYMIPMA